MNIACYCKEKGMDLEQYEIFMDNVNKTAQAIFENSKAIHKHDTGVYYPLGDIMTVTGSITDLQYFIMDAMKKIGCEFIHEDNIIYYRV